MPVHEYDAYIAAMIPSKITITATDTDQFNTIIGQLGNSGVTLSGLQIEKLASLVKLFPNTDSFTIIADVGEDVRIQFGLFDKSDVTVTLTNMDLW